MDCSKVVVPSQVLWLTCDWPQHLGLVQELEAKLVVVSGLKASHLPAEVVCLSHLEHCVDIAGSSIVVVAFYSRVRLYKDCFSSADKFMVVLILQQFDTPKADSTFVNI